MRWADVVSEEPRETIPPIPTIHRVGMVILALHYVAGGALGLVFLILSATGAITLPPPPPEVAERLKGLPGWQSIVSFTILGLGLIGGILVVLRYRIALPVLLVYLSISLLDWLYLYFVRGYNLEASLPLQWIPYVVGIVAILYVWLLCRRGILYKRFRHVAGE